MNTIGYSTYGPVRCGCGRLYKSLDEAQKSLNKDRKACHNQGGYSDREIVEVGIDGFLYEDAESNILIRDNSGSGVILF